MPITSLTIQVQPGTDVLHRVVCICHRRNLHILELTYNEQEITLVVRGDHRGTRGIERWLLALLHVLNIQRSEIAAATFTSTRLRSAIST